MSTKELRGNIFKYLQDVNRPFSINDIIEKCGKDYTKSAVQKAVDELVNKGKVIEKQYGKQKIYFLKQDDDENNETSSELSKLEQKLATLQDNLAKKEKKLKQLETELKKFNSLPSLSDLEDEQKSLTAAIRQLTENLETVKSQSQQSVQAPAESLEKIEEKHGRILSDYRKRKRICTNMIDAILEGYPKTKKHLIEEVGIETDDHVGFELDI